LLGDASSWRRSTSSARAAGRSVDVVLALAFAIAAPWTVLGFWNAVLGLWLLHGDEERLEETRPSRRRQRADAPSPSAPPC
jgi:membrane glycosyltransferase